MQSIRERDVDTVKHWFDYFEVKQNEKDYQEKNKRYQKQNKCKLIQQPLNANKEKKLKVFDLVDDYDPLYNAVHNAVITNNVELLDMLHSKGAG